MAISNINKTDWKRSSQRKMKTGLKYHRKHYINVCAGRLDIFKILIKRKEKMLCQFLDISKMFLEIGFEQHKNVLFMLNIAGCKTHK